MKTMEMARILEKRPRPFVRLAFALAVVFPLGACVSPPEHAALLRDAPVFSPLEFFAGRTQGEGRLDTPLSRAARVRVAGEGRVDPDGTLVLVQRIERDGAAPETRTWRIRASGDAGRYDGTLSSAQGPIAAEVGGNRLHIRFQAPGGLDTEQWLYLQRDGRTALNRMVVRKFGLPVAVLEETIRKADPLPESER